VCDVQRQGFPLHAARCQRGRGCHIIRLPWNPGGPHRRPLLGAPFTRFNPLRMPVINSNEPFPPKRATMRTQPLHRPPRLGRGCVPSPARRLACSRMVRINVIASPSQPARQQLQEEGGEEVPASVAAPWQLRLPWGNPVSSSEQHQVQEVGLLQIRPKALPLKTLWRGPPARLRICDLRACLSNFDRFAVAGLAARVHEAIAVARQRRHLLLPRANGWLQNRVQAAAAVASGLSNAGQLKTTRPHPKAQPKQRPRRRGATAP
jgi:hypothetical protein